MQKIIHFLNTYYEKAIELSNAFNKTRKHKWPPLLILNELSIQIGHIYNVIYQNEGINEINRKFDNLGDELSDVFLQLIALAESLKINLYHIKNLKIIQTDALFSLPVLVGQLNEAIMEKYGYRFTKPRNGFQSIDAFIENRLLILFYVSYQIAEEYQLDISNEFSTMLKNANNFLKSFEINKNECKEIKRKINKLNYRKEINKFYPKFKFAKIEEIKFLTKEELNYTITHLHNSSLYIVYLTIKTKRKKITKLLLKSFTNKKESANYFQILCNFIDTHNNKEIVEKIYQKELHKK